MSSVFSLFMSFLKIGAFTFGGGYAMIPLIEREVIINKGWIKKDKFLELLTLAQTAPGPISLNAAVFVGHSVAGLAGAVAAVLGLVLPSFAVILLIAVWFTDIRSNRYVDAAFKGMGPAVVALIAAPLINLVKGMSAWKILLAIAVAVVIWLLGVSPIYFIAAGAAAGVASAFFRRKPHTPANCGKSTGGTAETATDDDGKGGVK